MHILYVPDAPVRPRDDYLINALGEAGHVVEPAQSVAEAMFMMSAGEYDVVALDVASLADRPLKRIVEAARGAVLILIADAATAAERSRALRCGADACFPRPVHFMELDVRIEALSRLKPAVAAEPELALEAAARTARSGEIRLPLSVREYGLLDYLARHPGEVLSVERIQENVWGEASDPRPDLVRTNVARLRDRLARTFGRPFIITVRGHGYRFDPQ